MLSSASHTSDRGLFENKVFTDNITQVQMRCLEWVLIQSAWRAYERGMSDIETDSQRGRGREEALWRWEPDQSISKPGKPEASRSWRAWKQVFLQPLEGAQLATPPLWNAALVLLNRYTPSL